MCFTGPDYRPFELDGTVCKKASIHHCQFRGSLAFEINSKTKVR